MKYEPKEISNEMERKVKEFDEENELRYYKFNTYIVNLGTIEEFNVYKHEIKTDDDNNSYILTKGRYNKISYMTNVYFEVDDYLQRIDEYIFITDTF